MTQGYEERSSTPSMMHQLQDILELQTPGNLFKNIMKGLDFANL